MRFKDFNTDCMIHVKVQIKNTSYSDTGYFLFDGNPYKYLARDEQL